MQKLTSIKGILFYFLIILMIIATAGCVRYPNGPGPGPGDPEYQLKITVQVYGEINTDGNEGIYYIVLDNNGNPADGPDSDIVSWEDEYYYIQLDEWGIDFSLVEEGSASFSLTDFSVNDDEWEVIIDLNDLSVMGSSIDFNVVTTDSDNNAYDGLDNYLTIGTGLGSSIQDVDGLDDSEEGGEDFDIIGVSAEIIAF